MNAPQPTRRFEKILVANRGEIARRVLRGIRALGLSSVAVYSDADASAPHVAEADEAVRIGGAASADSYLNIDRILDAAERTGADAIHPGYGFLSERADLAERCAEAGIAFIGPSPQAIRLMGGKIESKRIAAQAGVPVIEGFTADDLAASALTERAAQLGYPLLVKASAGGGGRGMRIVRAEPELLDAVDSARHEASAAFGDGSLLVERYLEGPRHVEIQIFGDQHGNLIHCFERECSVQRRHQKVIEEAPSPALDDALRARMGTAAVTLGRKIGYVGAGTVEFVLDATGAFFFLEVNTRLQVEHPVTEAIAGLDLVRMQIEVAQGQALTVRQEDLAITGHAIEARLYAEDAERDFLPVTGRVALWETPTLPGLRIDSGVEKGSVVSVHYDAMLAKVIAHGPSREHARILLMRGLRQLAVGGLTTNRDFLLRVLEHSAFVAGQTDTHFIDRHLASGDRSLPRDPELTRQHAIAATLFLHEARSAERRAAGVPLAENVPSGFRNNRWRPQSERFSLRGESIEVQYAARSNGVFEIQIDGTKVMAQVVETSEQSIVVEIDGVRRRFLVARDVDRVIVHGGDAGSELQCVPRFPVRAEALLAGGCVAPMTGIVRKLCVAVGAKVNKGDALLLLEAMKMEHRLLAHGPGVVKEVRVREGQMVDPDQVMVVVEADAAS